MTEELVSDVQLRASRNLSPRATSASKRFTLDRYPHESANNKYLEMKGILGLKLQRSWIEMPVVALLVD
jgi:hypothetical protein